MNQRALNSAVFPTGIIEVPSVTRGPLPFVFLNLAMTADGKISSENRQVVGFGSAEDRKHMMELRATADAVMSGARTVDSHPVTLGPGGESYRAQRRRTGLDEYPLRLVVTRTASLDPAARIFQHRFSPILVLTTAQAPKKRVRTLSQQALVVVCGEREIDFPATFRWLRREYGVQRLLCEGGGEINDALFRAGLVDELHLTIVPLILGGRKAPTLSDGLGVPSLAQASRLRLDKRRQKGPELFLVYGREV